MRVNRRKLGVSAFRLVLCCVGAMGIADAAPQVRAMPQGMAMLTIEIDGATILAHFRAPRATLVGFDGAARNAQERETLGLARENLRNGTGMMRFDTQAACSLAEVVLKGDAARGAGVADEIGVDYRFACLSPEHLDSVALGFFIGFPALERVLVRYRTGEGRGGAELTQGNPVVGFVPF
ncbi:hypothetical protein ThidrDRAFT_1016 [Thiorhodococcus drewsii AZ1]|uniref:Uncharacterized protein n=2 Tax=Thiorhodococcus drewsii TaxID=210408 RepID=G2DYA4_9GAMM|nr:hypothetical protein ThidrDRAFT_1016 [Thiorhodococcus drewsii AZ1]